MRTEAIYKTASGQLLAGGGVLEGVYINSTTSGTMALYHGTTQVNTGTPMTTTITPAIGYHNFCSMEATAGLYVVIGAILRATFFVRIADF